MGGMSVNLCQTPRQRLSPATRLVLFFIVIAVIAVISALCLPIISTGGRPTIQPQVAPN
jgi:hypothetical protein